MPERMTDLKEIRITQIAEVTDLIYDLSYSDEINRYRSSFMYRGLPYDTYRLVPSIARNCGEAWRDLEGPIFRNFSKYAVRESPYINRSHWEQMIIGQHYGLPTRLMDWSCSPLMGLHFATLEKDLSQMASHDCVLWKVDIVELNRHLPPAYRQKLEQERAFVFTVDMLQDVVKDVQTYDADMGGRSFVTLEPPSIDSRIVNQYAYFTVTPGDMENMDEFLYNTLSDRSVKYIIDKDLRWKIREMLDRNNINERITSPGLEGITQWLKRHYYYTKK